MADMNRQALERFEKLCHNLEKVAPLAYVWHPTKPALSGPKPIAVTLQAATHGNEVGGIDVLNTFLQLLQNGIIQPPFPMGFAIGNPAGVQANRRFTERDLNRSFGQKAAAVEEEKRARALEPLLEKTSLFVDFHQTIEPSHRPFFIFPYTKASFDFAAALHDRIPIVTHWGLSFSKDGMCSDEYVNHRGGTGLTIELGQKGFDAYHGGVGLQVALAAVQYAVGLFSGTQEKQPLHSPELYTWRAVIPYEEGMTLREGLVNFQAVDAGDPVGFHQGETLRTPVAGWILFPKYPRDPLAPPPKELYRIIKRIQPDDLGKDGVINR
ncbi:succinylglutamate desuccinylase/aspartoacylase domain-containing protein [Oligoflexus tunisiensis]|uniref:succinylglutamate desuccinylase/aspartoacylase domain-containing protein n=1 Tax=Oligoflexus tunisiensis TaxID=708132 RepID=UPI00159EFFAA|nr:succinylglutamate desuccinylase/aspartoacylase family protein [Oligoflexus tunisiensis]